MHYFFFDAAGDPGFKFEKEGGSKPFYVVCIVSTWAKFELENKLNELRKFYKASPKYEFKYHRFPISDRKSFFTEIVKHDLLLRVCILDKKNHPQSEGLARLGGNALTNWMVAPMISHAIANAAPPITNFHFYIDQAKHDKRIAQNMRSEISHELNQRGLVCRSQVSPRDSKLEQCLLVADMVAGMVMDSFETNDNSLLRIIQPKLVAIQR
jgi:hypothetical protein